MSARRGFEACGGYARQSNAKKVAEKINAIWKKIPESRPPMPKPEGPRMRNITIWDQHGYGYDADADADMDMDEDLDVDEDGVQIVL